VQRKSTYYFSIIHPAKYHNPAWYIRTRRVGSLLKVRFSHIFHPARIYHAGSEHRYRISYMPNYNWKQWGQNSISYCQPCAERAGSTFYITTLLCRTFWRGPIFTRWCFVLIIWTILHVPFWLSWTKTTSRDRFQITEGDLLSMSNFKLLNLRLPFIRVIAPVLIGLGIDELGTWTLNEKLKKNLRT